MSNNELSSTYNVRGGNYDENLVYVNGFEIYRPFLVTSAQQEGLSFINADLVKQVEFSSGGWQPKYGDKLASVLSVEYKTPTQFAASLTASLVGGAAHAEARSANGRVSYLAGVRYKNAQYVLSSLKQQQGGYNPTFYDAQAFVNIGLGHKDDLQRTTLGIARRGGPQRLPLRPRNRPGHFLDRHQPVHPRVHRLRRPRAHAVRYLPDGPEPKARLLGSRLQMELLGSALISREFEYRDVEAAYTFRRNQPRPHLARFQPGRAPARPGLGVQALAQPPHGAPSSPPKRAGRWMPVEQPHRALGRENRSGENQ